MNRKMLSRLTFGKRLHLGLGGRKPNRHGRVLAHLHASDDTWVQGEMLRFGCTQFFTLYDNHRLVDEMLQLEQSARRARHSISGHAFYRIRPAENLRGDIIRSSLSKVASGRLQQSKGVRI